MSVNLVKVYNQFEIPSSINAYGNGHINDTYLCDYAPRMILQRINTNIFSSPANVMENICKVTEHLRKKILSNDGNPDRETLTVVPTKDGKSFYTDEDGNCYRMYLFIENSISYDVAENPKTLFYAGKSFGSFQKMLDDFPATELHETIVNFHNTPERVNQLKSAIENNKAGRLSSIKKEVDFALNYSTYASAITDGIKSNEIPLRVTHNDTKLNNVLFDADSREGLCVIDLDTVMQGSLLYDFGDALRIGASSGSEDETNLDLIYFDLEKFENFAKGFLEQTKDCLTKKEIELLPLSALILTYECGIRFLADYLNGDTYFKIHRDTHNLDRARNQFKLVADIESKLDEMKKIVEKYI